MRNQIAQPNVQSARPEYDAVAAEHRFTTIEQQQDALARLIAAQSDGYDRIEILLAAFAIVLTILVIYLGFRVERSAVRAAADEAKREIKDQRDEIITCVAEAKALVSEVSRLKLEVESHKHTVASDMMEIRNIRIQAETTNPKRKPAK